mgnify:CR=1 FL=1
MFKNRINTLRSKLKESNIDVALITDDDNVYYYTGYYDYLHMEFGRPTILVVPKEDKTILITPAVDSGLAEDDALVDHIEEWNDGVDNEWREIIPRTLQNINCIAIELNHISAIVRNYLNTLLTLLEQILKKAHPLMLIHQYSAFLLLLKLLHISFHYSYIGGYQNPIPLYGKLNL